jgi:ubiquitin-protein ligase E3 A
VDLYTNWLLVESISKQFGAFKNGFDLVMKDKNLADLFSAEELELLICGSRVSEGMSLFVKC